MGCLDGLVALYSIYSFIRLVFWGQYWVLTTRMSWNDVFQVLLIVYQFKRTWIVFGPSFE